VQTGGIGEKYPVFDAFTLRDELISRVAEYSGREEALKVVGLDA
jgi:hypothetical protein